MQSYLNVCLFRLIFFYAASLGHSLSCIRNVTRNSKTFLCSRPSGKPFSICKRITSREASILIQKVYDIDEENNDGSSLLIITSDASRGANRHTGLASILREINVHSEGKCEKNFDFVTATARRIHTMAARDNEIPDKI